jgi:hypothetical protein
LPAGAKYQLAVAGTSTCLTSVLRLNADQLGPYPDEALQNPRSPECFPHNNTSKRINGVNLKSTLGRLI